MEPKVKSRGKLAYKFLFWFLAVSLGPMGFIAWHLIAISQETLKSESLRNQRSTASGFAETVSNFVARFRTALTITARLEGFSSMDHASQERDLNRVMQQNPEFLELTVADGRGKEVVRWGRYRSGEAAMRDFFDQLPFTTAMKGQDYIGGLSRFQGLYPTLTIAVPIPGGPNQPNNGVLIGQVSLSGLSQMLKDEFQEEGRGEAAVVAGDVHDVFLVAHSDPGLAYGAGAGLPAEVSKAIMTQSSKRGGGEIELGDGKRVLGAYAEVKETGWIVYVQQPIENAYLAATQMRAQVVRVLLWVVVITLLLSLAIAGHITQPIRVLQQAAERLTAGQFEDLPEMTLTNDEIGDLAQSFIQMSDSLKEKTGELMHAKEELTKYGRDLERRVESRTRELKAAQDELIKKERLAAIGQMASVVGHEIRNPLAVINNSIFFIKTKMGKEGGLDPKVERHISIIQSEVKQANSIIDEILTYSRSREMKPEFVKINHFLDDLLSTYPFPQHIRVAKKLDARDPTVRVDPDELRQAVRNLVGNGVEVMPQQGSVRVGTEVLETGWVRIDIGDTGPGIPPEIVDKIFTPFYTTKARGTGLGLAVVKKVLDRHGGRVDVTTEIGRGSVFHLFLPLAAPAPGAKPAPAAQAAVPQTAVRRTPQA
ncbi:MAG: HAMP domain-containing protein [Elusimicrobia bacterium]|nr:HAMP domain-containing protein [Elusimicrobiota bacterium]